MTVYGSYVKGFIVICSGTNQIHIKGLCELIQGKTFLVCSSLRRLHGGGPQRKQDVEQKSRGKFLV